MYIYIDLHDAVTIHELILFLQYYTVYTILNFKYFYLFTQNSASNPAEYNLKFYIGNYQNHIPECVKILNQLLRKSCSESSENCAQYFKNSAQDSFIACPVCILNPILKSFIMESKISKETCSKLALDSVKILPRIFSNLTQNFTKYRIEFDKILVSRLQNTIEDSVRSEGVRGKGV